MVGSLRGGAIEKKTVKAWGEYAKEKYSKEDGWFLQYKGFPDVVMYNTKTHKIVFVELKSNNHDFHNHQKQMLHFLTHIKEAEAKVVHYRVDLETGKAEMSSGYPKNFEEEKSKRWEGVADAEVLGSCTKQRR
jgi:hypothetical protein